MKSILIFLLSSALFVGCATVGNKFDIKQVDSFQPGITTKEDALAKLGNPRALSTGADGYQVIQWMYAQANALGIASGANVVIIFDKDGKMVRVSHRAEQ
jgi:outer membrane protein assembly factor BamE (lipoprotein component of BamABCDE complex)